MWLRTGLQASAPKDQSHILPDTLFTSEVCSRVCSTAVPPLCLGEGLIRRLFIWFYVCFSLIGGVLCSARGHMGQLNKGIMIYYEVLPRTHQSALVYHLFLSSNLTRACDVWLSPERPEWRPTGVILAVAEAALAGRINTAAQLPISSFQFL